MKFKDNAGNYHSNELFALKANSKRTIEKISESVKRESFNLKHKRVKKSNKTDNKNSLAFSSDIQRDTSIDDNNHSKMNIDNKSTNNKVIISLEDADECISIMEITKNDESIYQEIKPIHDYSEFKNTVNGIVEYFTDDDYSMDLNKSFDKVLDDLFSSSDILSKINSFINNMKVHRENPLSLVYFDDLFPMNRTEYFEFTELVNFVLNQLIDKNIWVVKSMPTLYIIINNMVINKIDSILSTPTD